jgi:hypothetical protein
LSSNQMNPQLSHRKNRLLDHSATTVSAVWLHTGQCPLVRSPGGWRRGTLKSGIGVQRCHIHVDRQWPHRNARTLCVTPRATGSVAPHDGQCSGDESCSRRPLRARARRS